MKKRKQQGQAAIEYLASYGWVLLVLVLSIGALAYFGIIDTTKYIPNACFFETGISCNAFKMTNDTFFISLQNSYARDLKNVSLTVNLADCTETQKIGTLKSNTHSDILTFCHGRAFPKLAKGALALNYTFEGETVQHTMYGKVTVRQEE